jgi:hypothetical protein
MKMDPLADLDKEIVKQFWDLHENKEDPMMNFRYRLCRLMKFFLDKRLVKEQCSKITLTGHQLPDNWVYPRKLHGNLRLPPCARVLFQPLMLERTSILRPKSNRRMMIQKVKNQIR